METEFAVTADDNDGTFTLDLDATYYPNPASFQHAMALVMEQIDPENETHHPAVYASHAYYASAFDPKIEPWKETLGDDLYWRTLTYVAPVLQESTDAINAYEEDEPSATMVMPHLVLFLTASLYAVIEEENDALFETFQKAFDAFTCDLSFEEGMLVAPVADLLLRIRQRDLTEPTDQAGWKGELQEISQLYALGVDIVAGLWDSYDDAPVEENGADFVEQIDGIKGLDAHVEICAIGKDLRPPLEDSTAQLNELYTLVPEVFHEGLRLFWLRERNERYVPENTLAKKARAMWPAMNLLSKAYTGAQWAHLCQYLSSDLMVQKAYEVVQDYYKHGYPHFTWAEIRTHVVSQLMVNLVRPELLDEWSKLVYGHPELIGERDLLLKVISAHMDQFTHFPWYENPKRFH